MTSSSNGKLNLRPLPHLDFILGWPGIPGSDRNSRNAAHIAGNVEVRLGSKGMKAKWLRIELRKIETVPGGENWGELIGSGPIDVWSARPGNGNGDRETDADGTQWEVLRTADFPFRINIPEALPPTARIDKLCGIQYEVVTSLCVKTKKGFMRKEDTSSVIQSVQPVILDKHELHSTWPAYNQADTHSGERGQMRAKLRRDRYCYAPGDKVRVKVIVSSNRVEPAKLKSVAVTIKETVTFHGVKPSKKSLTSNSASAQPSMQRTEVVTQKAKQIGKKLYKGDSKDYDLELTIPKNHSLMTISTAKHIEVSYTMRLYCDISKNPIIVDHIPMMMTTFPRQASLATIKKIGFVEGLSERVLLIDDDVDETSTVQGVSRSVRPAPTRSLSYSGSSTTNTSGTYDNLFLQRRDTVMTHATGGMAGRGIPGMLFNGGQYVPPSASPSIPYVMPPVNAMPRSAFAGPDQYEDDEPQLSAMERSALYHHSNNPTNAMAVGMNFAEVASLEPTRSHFSPISRDMTPNPPNPRASIAGYPSMHSGPISRPTTAQAAEEEKERLYERARQQAERNQRRADEHRAMLASGATFNGNDHSALRRPMSVDGAAAASTLPAASEAEKLRLFDRARREAEAYQRGFSQGATFPSSTRIGSEDSNTTSRPISRMQTPGALQSLDEGEARTQFDTNGQANRESTMYWLDDQREQASPSVIQTAHRQAPEPIATTYPSYQSAEQEKARLYAQAKAQADEAERGYTHALTPSTSNNSNSVSQHVASPIASSQQHQNSAVNEKEQLKRYYEAQNAVQKFQTRLGAEEQAAGGSSSSGDTVVPAHRGAAASSPPNGLGTATEQAGAPTEKEQLARYHAAQAEVQRQQAAQSMSTAQTSQPLQVATSSANPVNGHGEKEQLARYHAAQQEVQRHHAAQVGASASSTAAQGSSSQQQPPPASSSTTEALSEKQQLARYHEAQQEVQRHQASQQQATGQGSSSMGGPSTLNVQGPPPSYNQSGQTTIGSTGAALQQSQQPTTSMTDKEQMRKYWEAKDREAQHAGIANGNSTVASPSMSSAATLANANAASPTMISPRPVYAPNFHAMPSPSSEAPLPPAVATSPLPQGAFAPPQHAAAPSPVYSQGHPPPPAPKPRVVSYQPQTQYSQQQPQQQPRLPSLQHHAHSNSLSPLPFQQLTLNHRGGTPNPFDGPWAQSAAPASRSNNDVPPPIPPKTAIQHS